MSQATPASRKRKKAPGKVAFTQSNATSVFRQLYGLRPLSQTEIAKAICERNLFDFRFEFGNHVTQAFQGMAQRLTDPLPQLKDLTAMRQ